MEISRPLPLQPTLMILVKNALTHTIFGHLRHLLGITHSDTSMFKAISIFFQIKMQKQLLTFHMLCIVP